MMVDTSYQETIHSLVSRLNYRPDAQLRGRQTAAGSPVSLTKEKYVRVESSHRNGGEWEKPTCLLSTLRDLKEKDKRERKTSTWMLIILNTGSFRVLFTISVLQMEMNVQHNIFKSPSNTDWW